MAKLHPTTERPTNKEADAYKQYLENQANTSRGGARLGTPPRTDEQKKWDAWEASQHSDKLSEYQSYKNQGGGARINDPTTKKWQDFETETFGSKIGGFEGSGEGGKYTVQDLYIKMSDKRYKDRQRDLLINKEQTSHKGGSGRSGKSGGKTGGKTSGPGNPNTGGGGAGDANL